MVLPEARKINETAFSVYGIPVVLRSHDATWLNRLRLDFDWFLHNNTPALSKKAQSLELEFHHSPVSSSLLPDAPARKIFPECVAYENGNERWLDYHGGAYLQESPGTAKIWSEDMDLAHEVAYLWLLSHIGTALDRRGIHRVHALGIRHRLSGKSALVLIPSGGGKSTLALQLLTQPDLELLSDDTPLVDRRGRLLPFPMRLAFREDFPLPGFLAQHAQRWERRKHGAKKLLAVSDLPTHAQARPMASPGSLLVVAVRHGSRQHPRLRPLSRARAMEALMRDLVVGQGIPQVVEHVLRAGLKSLPKLTPVALSRMTAAGALVARARPLALDLSQEHGANARLLANALAGDG